MSKNKKQLATLAVLAVYIMWGFSFLLSAVVQRVTTPFVLLAYRFDVAALLLALPLMFRKRKLSFKGKNIKKLFLLGLLEPCLYFIGEQYGVRYTNSAFSGIMIAVIPIVTILLSVLILKERPSRRQWLFSILSIIGIIIIVLSEKSEGTVSIQGVLFLTGAVITGAAFIVTSRLISEDFTVYERTLVMQIMGAIFYTILALIENQGNPTALLEPLAHTDVLAAILFLAAFSSVLGYILYNFAIANAPVALVAVMANLTTVISVIAGVVFMGDSFTPIAAVAMIAVIIGIVGVQKS